MKVADKLNEIRADLRAMAKQCIDNDDDECCSIALLQASTVVIDARDKLTEYGMLERDFANDAGAKL